MALGAVLQGARRRWATRWQWYRVPAFFGRTVDDEFIPGPLLRGLLVTMSRSSRWSIGHHAGVLGACDRVALRLSPSWAGRALAPISYLELVRSTPLLIQTLRVLLCASHRMLGIGRFWTGVLSLSLFEATLAAEVMRGSIQAVPCRPVGSRRALWASRPMPTLWLIVVLPQALPLMIPPLTERASQPGQALRDRERHRGRRPRDRRSQPDLRHVDELRDLADGGGGIYLCCDAAAWPFAAHCARTPLGARRDERSRPVDLAGAVPRRCGPAARAPAWWSSAAASSARAPPIRARTARRTGRPLCRKGPYRRRAVGPKLGLGPQAGSRSLRDPAHDRERADLAAAERAS